MSPSWRPAKVQEKHVSVGEDARTEEEEKVKHEFGESLPIINFASCTSDELIEFIDLTDREELLYFFVIYFATVTAKAEKEAEAAEIGPKRLRGWGKWIRKRTIRSWKRKWREIGMSGKHFAFLFLFSTQHLCILSSLLFALPHPILPPIKSSFRDHDAGPG